MTVNILVLFLSFLKHVSAQKIQVNWVIRVNDNHSVKCKSYRKYFQNMRRKHESKHHKKNISRILVQLKNVQL